VRDFRLNMRGESIVTDVKDGYVQNGFKITRNLQINPGLR